MASLSQLIANRANAQHSTGPRTPEGKARSSRNRLTHGLCGPHTILADEDPAEYQYLLDALMDEHDPASPTETLLVAQMAQAQWKLNRIARFEANLFAPGCDDQRAAPSGDEAVAAPVPFEPNRPGVSPASDLRSPNSLAVSSLVRYESAAHRAFDRALANLLKLKSARRPKELTPAEMDAASDRHLLDLVFGAPNLPVPPPAPTSGRANRTKPTPAPSTAADTNPIATPPAVPAIPSALQTPNSDLPAVAAPPDPVEARANAWLDAWIEGRPAPFPLSSLMEDDTNPNEAPGLAGPGVRPEAE